MAGTVVLATGALATGAPGAWAQIPPVTLPSTTTTTAAPTTTTTAPPATTTTTAAVTTTTEPTTTTTAAAAAGAGSGGALAISAPTSANLSNGTSIGAGSLSAHLGAVTVSDSRTGVVSGWTATVTSSAFTTGGGSAPETIAVTNVSYWSGPATATTGLATFLPGQLTAGNAAPCSGSPTAFSAVTASGGTSATWNPTVVVAIPPSAVVGQYHGTITHSVA